MATRLRALCWDGAKGVGGVWPEAGRLAMRGLRTPSPQPNQRCSLSSFNHQTTLEIHFIPASWRARLYGITQTLEFSKRSPANSSQRSAAGSVADKMESPGAHEASWRPPHAEVGSAWIPKGTILEVAPSYITLAIIPCIAYHYMQGPSRAGNSRQSPAKFVSSRITMSPLLLDLQTNCYISADPWHLSEWK